MNLCRVNINSKGNGWRDERSVEGEIITEADGAVSIKYALDGDSCILTVKGGRVIQERRGGQDIVMTFEEGKRTQCIIGNGNLSGSFEIYTRSLKFISAKGGYKMSLEYSGVSDGELINLTLTAVKKGNYYEN